MLYLLAVQCSGIAQGSSRPLQHTSILSGQHWLDELLGGHDGRFHNEIGMQKFVFRRLLTTLEMCTGLRGTQHVSAAEQVAIFLHFVCRGLSNRALQERFQHSGDTIMKWVLSLITQALYWLSIQVYLSHPQCPDIRTNILWLCKAPHLWCTHSLQDLWKSSLLSVLQSMSQCSVQDTYTCARSQGTTNRILKSQGPTVTKCACSLWLWPQVYLCAPWMGREHHRQPCPQACRDEGLCHSWGVILPGWCWVFQLGITPCSLLEHSLPP